MTGIRREARQLPSAAQPLPLPLPLPVRVGESGVGPQGRMGPD